MTENVGELEVTVTLDPDGTVRAQARQSGNQAGEDFDRAFERRISQSQGFQRALRDIEHQGRASARRTAQGMNDEIERGFFRRLRRGFRTTFADVTEGLTRFRRIALGIGAALGPIIVPLLALIAEIGPAIAIALPAIATLGAGIAVIALSTEALGKAFKPLVEGFKSLKGPISAILTEGIRPLVQELSDGLVPILRNSLGRFAALMNDALGSVLRFAGSEQGLRLIRQILFSLVGATRPLVRSLVPLTRALLTITRAAVPGFELLNEAFEDMIVTFDRWIRGLAQSGDLQREITESVGVLITTLKAFGNIVIGVIQGLRILGDIFAPIVAAFESLGIGIRDVAKFLTVAAGLFFTFFVPVAALVSVLGSLGTVISAIGTAIAFLASPIGIVLALVALLAGAFVLLWQNSEAFRTAVGELGTALVNLGQAVLPVLIEAGENLMTIFREDVLPVIRDLAKEVGENLAPAIEAVADFITNDLIPSIPIAVEQFKEWWPQIRQTLAFLGKLLVKGIEFWSFVVGRLVPALFDVARVMAAGLVVAVRLVIAVFRVLKFVGEALADGFQAIGRAALAVNDFFVDLWGQAKRLASVLGGALKSAINSAKGALDGINGVLSSVAGFIDGLIGRVEALISALGRIRVPDINLPGPSIPGIPATNKMGSIVDKPLLTWVGEGPWREAIIPDPKAKPKRALQLAKEIGLDKLIMNNAPAPQSGNTVSAVFNIYESGNGRGTAGQVDARLRLMMGV